jgi:hypothetical protein
MFRELLDDLTALCHLTDIVFVCPDRSQLPVAEREMIRVTRLLLEGNAVLMPGFEELNGTLVDEPPEQVLALADGAAAFSGSFEPFHVTILDHKIDIGGVSWFHPGFEADNPDDIRAAVEGGRTGGTPFKLKATDGSPARAFLTDLWTDPNKPIIPVPLGLTGISEHPALQGSSKVVIGGGDLGIRGS